MVVAVLWMWTVETFRHYVIWINEDIASISPHHHGTTGGGRPGKLQQSEWQPMVCTLHLVRPESIYQREIDWAVPNHWTILVTSRLKQENCGSATISHHRSFPTDTRNMKSKLALLTTLTWPQVSLIVCHQNDIVYICDALPARMQSTLPPPAYVVEFEVSRR